MSDSKPTMPTIEELEAILNSGGEVPIEILPNGELRVRESPAGHKVIVIDRKKLPVAGDVVERVEINGGIADVHFASGKRVPVHLVVSGNSSEAGEDGGDV